MIQLQKIIEKVWNDRSLLTDYVHINAIREVISLLDEGKLRCAEPINSGWQVNEWVKKAVVLYFPIQKMEVLEAGIFEYHDKIPLKRGYQEKGIRVVPHAVARYGAYISKGVILMPSYVNIGAYVDGGENDNLIVQKIAANPKAIGIFGFSFLEENMDKLRGLKIDGVEATFETISSGKFPASRPLFIYVKKAHIGVIPGLKEFASFFVADEIAGPEGPLSAYGLVADPELTVTQAAVANETPFGSK